MERFCGYSGNSIEVADNKRLKNALAELSYDSVPKIHLFSFRNFSLAVSGPQDYPLPKTIETSRFFLYAGGRFDNEKFLGLFGMESSLLDEMFSTGFDDVLADIRGDFVLILYNKKETKLVCVRDQIGARPLYYCEDEKYFCFASQIAALRKMQGFSLIMDNQWIADSLSLIKSEKDRTPYLGIKKLSPGNKLEVDNEINITPYWSVESIEIQSEMTFDEATRNFSQKLNHAVNRRIIGHRVFGSELSGGLDSSGVTAVAYHNLIPSEQSFFAFSHTLNDQGKETKFPFQDEREYSQGLTEKLGIQNHLLCLDNGYGILDSLIKSFRILSGPSQQGFHFYSDVLLEAARVHGVEILLSGFGGDEGVSSNAPGYFRELLLRHNRSEFRDELLKYYERKGMGKGSSLLRFIYKYYLGPIINHFNISELKRKQREAQAVFGSIDSHFLELMNIKSRFKEKFIFPDEDTVLERQIRKVTHDHISQRLEYSYLTGIEYGIEYAYPLWDIDLLQFYLSLPVEFKFRNGMGRALYREALKDLIPDQIRLRNDKSGFTIPSVFTRIINDYDQIEKLIIRCRDQNQFHYLDYSFMLGWLKSIKHQTLGMNADLLRPGAFINAIQILLLQDLERKGEFHSGIQI